MLDAQVFESVDQVREITEGWLHEHDEARPADSLGWVPRLTFMPRRQNGAESIYINCVHDREPTRQLERQDILQATPLGVASTRKQITLPFLKACGGTPASKWPGRNGSA